MIAEDHDCAHVRLDIQGRCVLCGRNFESQLDAIRDQEAEMMKSEECRQSEVPEMAALLGGCVVLVESRT